MIKTVSAFALFSLVAASASAQEAPAPRQMPRTPVSRQVLVEARDPMPASRQLQGPAAIIDGERLRIAETDLRLFGVVPPQLAASFGPQARAALDALANGQSVACQIRDRDRDGRLLATCRNASDADMALELLKRGLAVTARGSIAGTELAASYLAAEQSAQNQKIGLWSVALPPAAAPVSTTTAALTFTPPPAPKQESAALPAALEIKKEDKTTPRADKAALPETENQARIAADVLAQQAQARIDDAVWTQNASPGFFERYQILIAGFLMLATVLSVAGAMESQRRRDRREETKAAAAALRGEMMAARGICLGRVKSIANEADDRAVTWPRIRSTLYQAYVGRLGLLGAELARQIASVYGQASDYAALYNPNGIPSNAMKKQALETLMKHIDGILPKLAEIEKTGLVRFRPAQETRPAMNAESETRFSPAGEENAPPFVMARGTAVALWETVRSFIQNHRSGDSPAPPPTPADPGVAEYAAIIEADMARYQQSEPVESLDISSQKKKG